MTRPKRILSTHVLRLAILGIVPVLSACSANKPPEEHAKIEGGLSQPSVISSRPSHDSTVKNAADEQLAESDYALLQQLGPRAIWDRIGEKNKAAAANRGKPGPATTESSFALTKPAPTSRPAQSVADLEKTIPVIPLPDGRVRMIYPLQNYGGSTVTATQDGGTSRKTVTAKAGDLAPLVAALSTQLGEGGTIAPLPNENTLIITCTAPMKTPVLALLAQLDQPQRQVEINAKMFEVTRNFDFQYGAQLLLNRVADDSSQQLASTFSTKKFVDALQNTGGGTAEGSVLRLIKVFSDAGVSIDGTFQLLSESGLINVVASPRMTVAAGQTGYMLAGTELPIQSSTIINNAQQTTTSYKPVGVQLYITPQAMGPDSVKLHAISIVSAVSGFVPLPTMLGDQAPSKLLVNPIIDSREAETTVTIDNGNTLVFGGLRMIRTTTREAKIPFVGDIPGLGWLFKNHRSQKQTTDLYFFVTPTLL